MVLGASVSHRVTNMNPFSSRIFVLPGHYSNYHKNDKGRSHSHKFCTFLDINYDSLFTNSYLIIKVARNN